MTVNIDWSGLFNFLITSGMTATALLLWRVSLTVERLESEQTSHSVLDDTRFAAANKRIDELRDEVRSR